ANGGDYEVVVSDANGCNSATETTTVEVSNPVIDDIGNNGPVFIGEEASFTLTVSGGIEPYSYSWSGPDGFSSIDQNPIIPNVTLSNVGNYNVVVTDDNGCNVTDSTTLLIFEEVNKPEFYLTNYSYCQGNTGATVEVTNPQMDVTYELILEDGIPSGRDTLLYDGNNDIVWDNVLSINVPADTITSYIVKAYREEVPSEYQLSDTIEIVEHPLPTVDTMSIDIDGTLVPVPDNLTVSDCKPGSGYIIGLGTGFDASTTYELILNGNLDDPLERKTTLESGNAGLFSFDNSYSYIGTYTIRAVSGFGCPAWMAGSFTIEGDELQLFDLQAENDGRYCEDDPDGVELSLSGSESGVEYIVLQDGSPVDTITGNGNALDLGNYLQVGSEATTYSVVAYSTTTGCPYLMNNSIEVEEVGLPDAGNLTVTDDGHYCEGSVGVDIILEITQEEGVTYELFDVNSGNTIGTPVPGNASGGDITFEEYFTIEGTYRVRAVIDGVGCEELSNEIVVEADPLPENRPILGEFGFCPGDVTNLIVENTQNGVVYQLFDVKDGTTPYGSPVNGNGATRSFAVADSSTYTILATYNNTGCQRNFEDTVKVVEYKVPNVSLEMVVDSVVVTGDPCAPKEAIVSIENPEEGVTYYLWRDGNSSYSSFVEVTQPGLPEVEFPDAIIDRNGHYYIRAIGDTGCEVQLTDEEDIHIEGAMTAYGLQADDNLCQGDGATPIETNGSDSDDVVYKLRYSSTHEVYDSIAGDGGNLTFDPPVSVNSSFYLEATDTITGCVMVMDSVNIKFNPLPKAFEMTGSGVYCGTDPGAVIGLSGSEYNVEYYLIEENLGLTDSIDGKYSGGEIAFTEVDVAGVYTVYAKNRETTCTSSMKDTVRVKTMPEPEIPQITEDTICYCSSDPSGIIKVTNAENGVTYQVFDHEDNIVAERIAQSDGVLELGPVYEGSYFIRASYGGDACIVERPDSVRLIEIVEPVPSPIPVEYDSEVCYGDSSTVVYDISVDDPSWHYKILKQNGDEFLSEEDGTLIPGDQISWKIGESGSYYISIYTECGACGEEVGGSLKISVNDEISVPIIADDEIGICHNESTADITLDGQQGKTVFYHLYDSNNINSSLDSVYAGVDEIVFANLIQGKYFVRAQDIKSECFSAYTDTIFVQPYLTESDTIVYNTMFWDELSPDIDTIAYMSEGKLSLNIDMALLDSVNSGIFNSYSVVQYNNPSTGFEVDNDGYVTITEGSDDYIVAGKYADECALYPITKNWLKVREDSLVAHDAFIYLNEDEYSDSVKVVVDYSDIDDGYLQYSFVNNSDSISENLVGDFFIDNNGNVRFNRAPSFYGDDRIRYIVTNLHYPSRTDTAYVWVYVGNKNMTEDRSIFIPNAFSPNGDGINDYFVISSNRSRTEESTFEVFNRWGTLVYRSQGKVYQNDWDGKSNINNMIAIGDDLPNGVYFYVYTVKANVDGETVIKKFNGFVELRR
ncbi:MAG: hypothetical protein PWQ06_1389, partial [Anaerophaga sp.]|nr:hypothetical protein [Anaerophaga sp.]